MQIVLEKHDINLEHLIFNKDLKKLLDFLMMNIDTDIDDYEILDTKQKIYLILENYFIFDPKQIIILKHPLLIRHQAGNSQIDDCSYNFNQSINTYWESWLTKGIIEHLYYFLIWYTRALEQNYFIKNYFKQSNNQCINIIRNFVVSK